LIWFILTSLGRPIAVRNRMAMVGPKQWRLPLRNRRRRA
jgi:hypothetical protein